MTQVVDRVAERFASALRAPGPRVGGSQEESAFRPRGIYMTLLPPIPSWENLHPLVVHFPVALLMVTPLFLLGAVVVRGWSPSLIRGALILSVLGTVAAFVAVESGEAAGELAERTPAVSAVLERHEEWAESLRTTFLVLTLLLLARVAAPRWMPKMNAPPAVLPLNIAFFALYAAGTVLVINTAHLGGRLVHEYGVHAMLGDASEGPEPADADGD